MKRIVIVLCLCLLMTTPLVAADDLVVISDIEAWRHPTKDVLAGYKVTLKAVELHNQRVYPVFFVEMPWDPQTSPNAKLMRQLEWDLLSANGYHDYALDIRPDGIVIGVRWGARARTMSEEVVRRPPLPR